MSKKVNRKKIKAILDNWNQISATDKQKLEKANNMSAEDIKTSLENQYYNIDYLSITYLRELRKEMEKMSQDKIEVVERVNESTFDEIKQEIEKKIEDYTDELNKEHEVKAAIQKRKQEVKQELIEEGIVKVENGYEQINDIFKYQNRMFEAEIEVMKEFGYHKKGNHPIYGPYEF